MTNVAVTEKPVNALPLELVRDGQDLVVRRGSKELGYAQHWRDSRRNESGFVATAYLRPPPEGGAAGTDLEVRKLADAVRFIAREGVGL